MSKRRLRWGIEQRLEFIERQLFWSGVVARRELAGAFGVSLQQASADFVRYLELAPGNASYSRKAGGYVRGGIFQPRLIVPDSADYLAQLRLAGEHILDRSLVAPLNDISFELVPGPARRIDPLVLRAVIDTIRRGLEIEMSYQSMARPEPEKRWIAPHTLAFDGFRWHARARCSRDGSYKDFVLARMSNPGAVRPFQDDPPADRAWQHRVQVAIGPHPDLPEGAKRAVETDYGMAGGVSVIEVRECFLWYFLKRFRP